MKEILQYELDETIVLKSQVFRFKKASEDDFEAVLRLSEKMLEFHKNLDDYYGIYEKYEDPRDYYSDQLKQQDKLYIIVYNKDGQPIALSSCYIVFIPDTDAPKIGNMVSNFVCEQYRNFGIGSKLLEYRLDWFRKNNVKFVEMSVDARNENALKLWENKGFKQYQIKLKMNL